MAAWHHGERAAGPRRVRALRAEAPHDRRARPAPDTRPPGRERAGLGMLALMGPTRTEILGALSLVGVLVLLMLVLVWWAIPPGGPPALQ